MSTVDDAKKVTGFELDTVLVIVDGVGAMTATTKEFRDWFAGLGKENGVRILVVFYSIL